MVDFTDFLPFLLLVEGRGAEGDDKEDFVAGLEIVGSRWLLTGEKLGRTTIKLREAAVVEGDMGNSPSSMFAPIH